MDRTRKVHGVYRRLLILRQADALATEQAALPAGPFRVIVADPPWHFENGATSVSLNGIPPYPTMTVTDIAALTVAD